MKERANIDTTKVLCVVTAVAICGLKRQAQYGTISNYQLITSYHYNVCLLPSLILTFKFIIFSAVLFPRETK